MRTTVSPSTSVSGPSPQPHPARSTSGLDDLANRRLGSSPSQPTPSASRAAWSLASSIKAARTGRLAEHFLHDSHAGGEAVPHLLFLTEGRSGLLVTALVPGSDAARVLRPRDVITSIDGKAIGNDKNIEFRPRERTSYRLLCDPLTKNLLSSLGWRDAPPELLAAAYRNGDAQEPVRELVVLQRILADEVNRGYDNLEPEYRQDDRRRPTA